MSTRTRLIGGVAALALLIAGALAVGAVALADESGDDPDVERQSKRDAFLERVAARLGIDVATLTEAIKGAQLDAVNEAEAAGSITSEQAAKARQRIESADGVGLGKFRQERHQRKHEQRLLKFTRGTILESSATAIGVTQDDLKAELAAGRSIADVADERGVSIDAVKSQILSDARARFEEAVVNGRVTRERADAALAALASKLDEALNKKRTPEPATP